MKQKTFDKPWPVSSDVLMLAVKSISQNSQKINRGYNI